MFHHFFQNYDELQGGLSFYKNILQDSNHQSCYYFYNPLDLLNDKSDEDELEDESDKKDKKPDTDFQDP